MDDERGENESAEDGFGGFDDLTGGGALDQAAIDALFGGGGAAALSSAPSLPPAPPPAPRPAVSAPSRRVVPQVGDTDLLAEVVLTLNAEIGRTEMTINDVLKLRPGSIIELDKLAGEPVELLISDRCVARGEVVVVDDNFGIRITGLGND